MSTSRKLLSVIVPAYNKPDYLRKCLQSLAAQSYRPIEVIVSDDQSPINLLPVVEEASRTSGSGIKFHYLKPPQNLRTYWNLFYAFPAAIGKYAMIMPHDDWLIDPEFLRESISIMETNGSCHICFGNTVMEDSDKPGMKDTAKGWAFMDGRTYLTQRLYSDLHPAYSAVVFDLEKLRLAGYMDYVIEKEAAGIMGIEPDEGFLLINLLGSLGEVAITGKIVSVRGNPPDSYSKSKFWIKYGNHGLFILHFRLYQYFVEKGFHDCAKTMRKNLLWRYPPLRYDNRILEYLEFDKSAQFYMLFGFLLNMSRVAYRWGKRVVFPR